MPNVADGVRSSISSSNKIAPVEVDPPPPEKALSAAGAGEGPVKSLADEPGGFSPSEETGTSGSLGSEDVPAGDNKADNSLQAASDKVVSQGNFR